MLKYVKIAISDLFYLLRDKMICFCSKTKKIFFSHFFLCLSLFSEWHRRDLVCRKKGKGVQKVPCCEWCTFRMNPYVFYKYYFNYILVKLSAIEQTIFCTKQYTVKVWLNGLVFIYEESGCGFKSCCSHLTWSILLDNMPVLSCVIFVRNYILISTDILCEATC